MSPQNKKHVYAMFTIFLVVVVIGVAYFLNSKISFSLFVDPQPEPIAESWGSIFGIVLLGPNCPVVRNPPEPGCDDKPFGTNLAVTTVDGARVIKEFKSDSNGRFNVEIPPGEYAIRSAVAANVLPYCASNDTVRVRPNDSTEIVISCDTGIR